MARETRDALSYLQATLPLNAGEWIPTVALPTKKAPVVDAEGKEDKEAPKKTKLPQVQRAVASFRPGPLLRAVIDEGVGSGAVERDDGLKVLPLIPPPSVRFKRAMDRVEASARARKLNLLEPDDPRCAACCVSTHLPMHLQL